MRLGVPRQSTVRRCVAAVAGALALATAGVLAVEPQPAGLVVSGPGVQTSTPTEGSSQPAWRPEYAHLAERLKLIGIPPGGKENFHIHALLHIYVHGLLSPVPADIGIESAKGFEASMHTHDATGIIHMEAPHPYPYTLGDFFAVWGVKLGPAQLGGLSGLGGDHLHFYVNGRPLQNPAAYVLKNGDSVVIGYGADSSFPHTPSTILLKELEKGEGGLGCGPALPGHKSKGCLVKPATAQKTSP
jgi:hypothetical protein